LIGFYLQSRQYVSAGTYIGTIDSLARKIGDPHLVKEDYYLRYRFRYGPGNYKSAAENLLKYQTLNDSLFNETTNRQIKQLELEYETEKNKNEITVLNQRNQLQQGHLDQVRLVKNFTIGGIVLLLLSWDCSTGNTGTNNKAIKLYFIKTKQLQHFLTEKNGWSKKFIIV